MGEAKSKEGIIVMEKKNRFSMLEIKDGDKKALQKEGGTRSASQKENIANQEYKRPKDFKVVVKNDEFEKNLQKHSLFEKVTTLEKKKVEIGINIAGMKTRAWAKIAIGVIIVIAGLRKFIFAQEVSSRVYFDATNEDVTEITKFLPTMTPINYIILGLLVLLFGYLYYSGKNKEKK